jgi:hypothetical protein
VKALGDGRTFRFVMAGEGRGDEEDSPAKVLRRARRSALARVERCTGEQRIIASFFDASDRIGGREEQLLDRELLESLESLVRYEIRRRICRVEGKGFVCRVVLSGALRVVASDPAFRIVSAGTGHRGVYRPGEDLRVRFRLTRPANLYLFDVDGKGQAFLLFPVREPGPGVRERNSPRNPLPAGREIVLPSPENKSAGRGVAGEERFVVTLPPGRRRTVEHLWLIALRGGHLFSKEEVFPVRPGGSPEEFFPVGNFRKKVLARLFRMNLPGRDWTIRVISFEIRGAMDPEETRSGVPKVADPVE